MVKKLIAAAAPRKRWSDLTDEEVSEMASKLFSKMVTRIPLPSASSKDND